MESNFPEVYKDVLSYQLMRSLDSIVAVRMPCKHKVGSSILPRGFIFIPKLTAFFIQIIPLIIIVVVTVYLLYIYFFYLFFKKPTVSFTQFIIRK